MLSFRMLFLLAYQTILSIFLNFIIIILNQRIEKDDNGSPKSRNSKDLHEVHSRGMDIVMQMRIRLI
jgi:hypothetical protein